MTMLIISEDDNYAPILDEVKRQDTKNNLTIGVFNTNSDIVLAKEITGDLIEMARDKSNITFIIDADGNVHEFDRDLVLFIPVDDSSHYVADVVTMLIHTPSRPSDNDFLAHQMVAIKSMTDDKHIHRHIDATLMDTGYEGQDITKESQLLPDDKIYDIHYNVVHDPDWYKD